MAEASASSKVQEKPRIPKDLWDKADIVIKGVSALVIGFGIAWYGTYSQKVTSLIAEANRDAQFKITEANRKAQFQIAEKNRKAQLIVQTMGNRENADSDMRAKMFDTLMTHYFNTGSDESARFSSKLRILELIALNFQDTFNPKPLFEELNAVTSDDSEKEELRKVARFVIKKQTEALVGGGGQSCSMKLHKGDGPKPIECIPPLQVKLLNVDADRIQLSVGIDISQSNEPPLFTSTTSTCRVSTTHASMNSSTQSPCQKKRTKRIKARLLRPSSFLSTIMGGARS